MTAEAVQAANFTPDFSSESPWGDTEIEQCVHETDNSITEVTKQYTAMSVTYEGAARKLVAAPEDFFRNLQTAMPGDTISDSFQLSNTTATSAEFFFHTETPGNLTDEELDLLKQFKLTITQNGKPCITVICSCIPESGNQSWNTGNKEKFAGTVYAAVTGRTEKCICKTGKHGKLDFPCTGC